MILAFRSALFLVSLTLCTVTNAALFEHSLATELVFIDDFLQTITVTTPILFYGASHTTLYVSDNGMVTFDNSFLGRTWPFTVPWIAPFGADISACDLKQQAFGADSTSEINQANSLVREIYADDGFIATHLVVITWLEAKKFSLTIDTKVNTFQLAIATDGSTKSYALFLYENIEWYPAKAIGISSGDPDNFYLICDTDKPATLFLPRKSSSQCTSTPGLVVLRIDQTSWTQAFSCINMYTPVTCRDTSGRRNKRCLAR